jgi:glycosyltransferase A (GT-A) superfamily protein (DUF2064 family)
MSEQSIALLYFSRNADLESQKKAWFSGNATYKNKQLAKSLIQQSSQAVYQSGFPVYHFHEGNQKGENFGERLANAYQELYEKGFNAVIAVGNDSPEIAGLDWQQIRHDLQTGKNVLGKSCRGGAYLLGITRASFQKDAFQNLPWKNNQLYTELFRQLNSYEEVVELDVLRDINSFFDLKKILFSKGITSLFRKIVTHLLKVEQNFQFSLPHFRSYLISDSRLRAPPVV